jgi:hypothetical protein
VTTALVGFAVLLLLCFFGLRVGFATLFVGRLAFARGWSPALATTGAQIMEDAITTI